MLRGAKLIDKQLQEVLSACIEEISELGEEEKSQQDAFFGRLPRKGLQG